jgi:hypothetical protein
VGLWEREREREREEAWDKDEGSPGNQVMNGRKTCEIELVKMKNVVRWVSLKALLSLFLTHSLKIRVMENQRP